MKFVGQMLHLDLILEVIDHSEIKTMKNFEKLWKIQLKKFFEEN